MDLSRFPRVPLAHAPTPLEPLDGLRRALGARVHLFDGDADREAKMAEIAEAARARGASPCVIPTGGSTVVGALGYARAALELVQQAAAMDLRIDYVVHASSSGGTQAGLAAGLHLLGHSAQVIGIDVEANAGETDAKVRTLAGELAQRLGGAGHLPAEVVRVEPGYAGPAYGVETPEMVAAVQRAARSEGLLLDPVYTGKAMAGLIGLLDGGGIPDDATVVFLHTGGLPGLFAYPEAFAGEG